MVIGVRLSPAQSGSVTFGAKKFQFDTKIEIPDQLQLE